MQNATQLVYNYLLLSSNNNLRTAASIAANTQLTVRQVCTALQNLQKRGLVVCVKQQQKRNMYSAVFNAAAQFNAARTSTATVAQAVTLHAEHVAQHMQQQQHTQHKHSFMQRIVQRIVRMFA